MKTLSKFSLFFLLTTISLCSFAIDISPGHPAIRYEGRIDFSQANAPAFIWQGSTLATNFTGSQVKIGFNDLQGQVFFNVELDGKAFYVQAKNGWITIAEDLSPRKHQLKLIKRSEASAGHARFTGLRLPDSEKITKPKPSTYKKRYIFYGDSITAGACNEDGEFDQWEDRSTHNNALSYGAITAAQMKADYRNIAISGIGISAGYQSYTAEQIWNRYYPDPKSEKTTPGKWQPSVVFLNYGENDDSISKRNKKPFPKSYTKRYIKLIKQMRKEYPRSQIVILRGGMYGGAKSESLIKAWNEVVANVEANDPNISHYAFKHWYKYHPRVKDHKIMASELTKWLEEKGW